MRIQQRLLLIVGPLCLAGCSQAPVQDRSQESAENAAKSKETPNNAPELPAVELADDLLYQLLLAEFASQSGDLGLSADIYLKSARQTRDPRLAQRATQVAVYSQKLDTALAAAQLWVELTPEEFDAQQSYAALLIRDGRVEDAVPHLKKLIQLTPEEDGSGFQVAAKLLAHDQDKTHALGIMEKLIAPYPDNPDALYAYAQLASQLEAYDKAENTLNTLLEKHPDYTQALLLRARVMHSQGKREAALASLRDALEQTPDNDQLRLTYARMLIDAHHFPEARKQFQILNRRLPDNSDVIYALALLAMDAGDIEAAEIHFTQLVSNGDHDEEARLALGQISEQRKRPKEAIEWYQSILPGDNYMSAQLQAARLIAKTQGIEAARRELQQLQLHTPEERVQRYLAEAELLSGADQPEEALDVYDEGLELFKDNEDLLYGRALLYEKLGRLDALERDLKRILENDPDNTRALNALGYTLTDRTDRHQEALQYIEKAYKEHPEDPAILDSMGWVLYHLGRREEALEYLQRAADTLEDAEIAAHLGEVLWSLGRKEEARKVWEKAQKHSPDNKVLQQTIKRFKP